MSTKIYNGVKFKTKDFNEVLTLLNDIRVKSIEIGNNSITMVDLEEYINYSGLIKLTAFEIFMKFKNDLSVDVSYFKSQFLPDFKFKIYLYPTKEGDIYGYFIGELNEYENLIRDVTDDFSYYDNCDAPDDINYVDWECRGVKWDELIPSGSFAENSFTYTIVNGCDLDRSLIQTKIKEVLGYLDRDNKLNSILK